MTKRYYQLTVKINTVAIYTGRGRKSNLVVTNIFLYKGTLHHSEDQTVPGPSLSYSATLPSSSFSPFPVISIPHFTRLKFEIVYLQVLNRMGSARIVCALPFVFMISAASAFSAATDVSSMSNGVSPFWPQHAQPIKRNSNAKNVQMCGRRLVDTVTAFCNGRLFTGYVRRSDPTMTETYNNEDSLDLHEPSNNVIDIGQDAQPNTLDSYWDKDMENSLSDFELNWPHSPKSLALKVLTEGKAHQRFRRNISEECCLKACSQNDMAKYCSRSGRGRRMAVY